MNKLTNLAIAAGLGLMSAGTALAETPTLYIGSYGGSWANTMKEIVIPPFEKAHDVNIVYVAGNSTDTLAKLQARRGNQELDVVFLDDGPMYQAINMGFCASMAGAPLLEHVYDLARFPNDKAVGMGIVATGLAYSKPMFEKKGWEPPTSWTDLTDPKYKGLLSIPPITNTYGLHALVMMARLNGGSAKNIDPGFEVIENKVASNVLTFEPSPGKMSALFQSGEIALAVWGNGRVNALADTGFPVGFVYPKEGAVALLAAVCPVTNSDVPKLARAFIAHLLTPEMQTVFAKRQGNGPVNPATELPPKLAKSIPYGDRVKQMVTVNWEVINEHRLQWTQRWVRRIEN